ncbi:MAG: NAD(P)H-hydrate epimerase [Planctomycetes bacterium]|nr:NAD(P)H-hydrate epimerase [Planctomycetota bacterium]
MSIPYQPGEALTCLQIRELDILAIEHVGVPALALMENAGRAVAEFVYGTLVDPQRSRVVILCGSGNNGGDGFVAARHLHNAGVNVTCILAGTSRRREDAAVHLGVLQRIEVPLIDASPRDKGQEDSDKPLDPAVLDCLKRADVIIDALLGTGSTGTPRQPMARLIDAANQQKHARRIAVDIPTGLDADAGTTGESCFAAHATVTLVAPKVGFSTSEAGKVLGRVVVVDIGGPRGLIPGRKSFSETA